MKSSLVLLAVLPPLMAGCPLQPDVVYDSGITPDSGSTDDGGSDGGTDGGTATGTVNASLVTTSIPSTSVIWTGNDLAFSQQDTLAQTATVDADSFDAGHLVIKLVGLSAGTMAGTTTLVSYSTPNTTQAWSCSLANANTCSVSVSVSNYDGINLSGSFSAQFNQPTIGTDVAALSGGTFIVSFPQ